MERFGDSLGIWMVPLWEVLHFRAKENEVPSNCAVNASRQVLEVFRQAFPDAELHIGFG
jgi:hypothetical protein